jgi:hypothetical protein
MPVQTDLFNDGSEPPDLPAAPVPPEPPADGESITLAIFAERA